MTEKEKYFYLLSISEDQLPLDFDEFGIEQMVLSSDGYYTDIEAIEALSTTLNNLNSQDVKYKFNSTEYPVSEEDEFEDKSIIELGNNFLKLLVTATDNNEISTSNLIGKVFSIMEIEEYLNIKDDLKRTTKHVIH